MAALVETETYEAEIYQLEITDPVIGGPDGIDNLQGKQLANRTNWLNANKQDKDALLTAIAALTTAADKLIYATGVDTFSITTLTAFARTLLDDADAITMRATLGVIDGIGVGQTWQDMTASRAMATTYTNTTGKPIMVSLSGIASLAGNFVRASGGVSDYASFVGISTASQYFGLTFIVPNEFTYGAVISGGVVSGLYWKELR